MLFKVVIQRQRVFFSTAVVIMACFQGDQISFGKNRPKSGPIVVKTNTQLLPRRKSSKKIWANSVIKTLPKICNQQGDQIGRIFAQSATDYFKQFF
jgi:hypothetical protein